MIILSAIAIVSAQPASEPQWNCADPQAQMEMNACAALDFERADAELNAAWREVVADAREADAELDPRYDRRPTSEAKLREAQRAWIVFRDAHCTYQGYGEARGGSMEPMAFEACRTSLTRERIRQLTGAEPEAAE